MCQNLTQKIMRINAYKTLDKCVLKAYNKDILKKGGSS